MDKKVIARKIRDAIFAQADEDGRVMHGDAMDRVIERVLAAEIQTPRAMDYSSMYWTATDGIRVVGSSVNLEALRDAVGSAPVSLID